MRWTRTATRRVRALTLVLAVTAFSMVGCIRYELGFVVNADGSGAMNVLMALSDQVTAMTGMTTEDALGLGGQPPPGATVEEYSQDGFTGIQLALPFASLQQLALYLGAPQVDSITSDFEIRPDGQGGWSFATTLAPAAEAAGPQAAGADALPPELLQGGWARVRVELPGVPAAHNADRIEGGAFIWDIDFTSSEPRQLRASTTASGDVMPAKPDDGHGILAGAYNGSTGASTLAAVALATVVVVLAARAVTGRRRQVRS